MKKYRTRLIGTMPIFVSLIALAAIAAPELYRWVDKEGKVTYSDTPPPKDAVTTQKKKLGDNSASAGEEAIPFALKSAMQRNPVILYANNCGASCDQARALLSKRGVPHVARNPEVDPGASGALKDLIGALSVPTLAIGTNSQIGFNESDWHSALDAAGYPKFNALSPTLKAPPKPVVEPLKVPPVVTTATAATAATAPALPQSPQ